MSDRDPAITRAIAVEIEALQATSLAELVRRLGAPDAAQALETLAASQWQQAALVTVQTADAMAA